MKLPPIKITENYQVLDYTYKFLVTIEDGPGHHGVSETLAGALYNAVWAWKNWEENISEPSE